MAYREGATFRQGALLHCSSATTSRTVALWQDGQTVQSSGLNLAVLTAVDSFIGDSGDKGRKFLKSKRAFDASRLCGTAKNCIV